MTASDRATNVQQTTDTFDSGGRSIRVERFESATAGRHPAVVLLHGAEGVQPPGGAYRDMARELAGHGYPAFLVHYLDSTGVRFSTPRVNPLHFLTWMQAVADASTYAGTQPHVVPNRLGLVGFSLGAYLALAVASQDARVGAVVECAGGMPDYFAQALRRLPPTLILHGAADPVVPVEEAHQLERLLRERQQRVKIKIYPGQGHRLQGEDAQDALRRAITFLETHLRGAPAGSRSA